MNEDRNIFLIFLIIAFIVMFIIIIAIATTSQTFKKHKTSGKDSIGKWKIIGTKNGPSKSYYFKGNLINPIGKYLSPKKPYLSDNPPDNYWIFDGQFLSCGELFLNYKKDHTVLITAFPQTGYLFDGYNFYLSNNINPPNALMIDPMTIEIDTVKSDQIYKEGFENWTVS